MGFFKKDEIQEKEVQPIVETKVEIKEKEVNIIKKKNLSLFEADTIQYIIENFPSMSVKIQEGLNNLANILENTIDYIEDKSSEAVKKNRDFKLSKAYRDTSIAVYDVSQNIKEYIQWMQQEYEKNIEVKPPVSGGIEEKLVTELTEEKKGEETQGAPTVEGDEKAIDSAAIGKEIEIYKDFSLKEPKGFKLNSIAVTVEDWDDLLVKTAEVLTKQYRKNKYSNVVVKEIKPVIKKSTQNSFRDTVIEMLNEYKINLDEFKIITK